VGKVVSIHSFRGGTGKSNLTANFAYACARKGARVAVLDTDLQSPGVHIVFNVDPKRVVHTLSDFLFGKCEILETAYDLTKDLHLEAAKGAIYLLPSTMSVEAISRIIDEGYDVGKLNSQFKSVVDSLKLDLLFVDTHPGMNKETLLTAAISDVLILLIRPDNQDFQGTAVLVEVARRLGVPSVVMVANKVVRGLDPEDVKKRIQEAFQYEVIGVLPLTEEMATLGSKGIFCEKFPSHPLSKQMESIALRLLADSKQASAPADQAAPQVAGQVKGGD
jgi:septum site-determining protein MinD